MLEKSFGLLFFLKQSKKNQNGERYIYLRITVDRISKELSTKRLWKTSRWNAAAGRAEGNNQDSKTLNAYLETLYFKALQAKKHLIDTDRDVSSEAIKNFLLGIGEKKRMIIEIFHDHNSQVKSLIGKEYTPATLQRYLTTLDHTLCFIRWKYNKEDMDIQLLDYDFISSFSFWLKTVKNCNHNTTMKYLTNFKKIVLICVKNGWLILLLDSEISSFNII
jgi:hypothetical protein